MVYRSVDFSPMFLSISTSALVFLGVFSIFFPVASAWWKEEGRKQKIKRRTLDWWKAVHPLFVLLDHFRGVKSSSHGSVNLHHNIGQYPISRPECPADFVDYQDAICLLSWRMWDNSVDETRTCCKIKFKQRLVMLPFVIYIL